MYDYEEENELSDELLTDEDLDILTGDEREFPQDLGAEDIPELDFDSDFTETFILNNY